MKKQITSTIVAGLLAISGSPSFARSLGGEAGGGGSASPGRLLQANEIKAILSDIQRPVAAFYKYVSLFSYDVKTGYLGNHNRAALGAKLFAGKTQDAIVSKVKTVKPTILDHGPCLDPDGMPMEAYTHVNPDVVCFSPELLAERGDIRASNGRTILLALAAHEYSHLLGTNEEEAVFIQKELALKVYSERAAELVASKFNSMDKTLTSIVRGIFNIKTMITNHGDKSELCYDIASLATMAVATIASTYDWSAGVAYASRYQLSQALPAIYKLNNLKTFCSKSPDTLAVQQKIFGNQREITIEQFLADVDQGPRGFLHMSGIVRRIDYGDYRVLALEIEDLASALLTLNDNWDNR